MQTVYDSVGTKPDLVRRLNDLIDEEAQVGEIAATLASLDDPLEIARVPAASPADSSNAAATSCAPASRARPPNLVSPTSPRKGGDGTAPAPRQSPNALGRHELDVARRRSAATTIATLSDFRVAILLIDDHQADARPARGLDRRYNDPRHLRGLSPNVTPLVRSARRPTPVHSPGPCTRRYSSTEPDWVEGSAPGVPFEVTRDCDNRSADWSRHSPRPEDPCS